MKLTETQIESIMEQAQVFASAWSLVGGPFDRGDGLEAAECEKANLRALLDSIAATVAADAVAPTLLGSPAEGHWGEPETPSDGHKLESDVDEETQPDERPRASWHDLFDGSDPDLIPVTQPDERAAFEAWCISRHGFKERQFSRLGDGYFLPSLDFMWRGYEARAAAQAATTLTDEQIDAVWDSVPWKDLNVNSLEHVTILRRRFARALLATQQGGKQ